jgi:hypothetical protein
MVAAAPRPISFDGPLGRQIIDLHVWIVRRGLLGTAGEELFGGFCQRLIDAGVPLWRGYAAMRTCGHCIRSGEATAMIDGGSSMPSSRSSLDVESGRTG